MSNEPPTHPAEIVAAEAGADDATELVRHQLAALAYRTQKVLRAAPTGFGDFDAGDGIRTPLQILRHMNRLIGFAHAQLAGSEQPPHDDRWEGAVTHFPLLLVALDATLAAQALPLELLKRLQQGPLDDAMTHAGQLAMLRRMAGSPIGPESFFDAEIRIGRFHDG